MFKDGKPLGAANDTGNVIPTVVEDEWAEARARDELFEDILDIEGPVRVAMSAVAGFAPVGIEDLDRGIAVLEGRIPQVSGAQLRAQADALRSAAEAQDGAGVRAAQAEIVAVLAALRQGE